jgi:hypothetical protein
VIFNGTATVYGIASESHVCGMTDTVPEEVGK